jgi:hypothetical protein
MKTTKKLSEIAFGEVFRIGEYEFIKFDEQDGSAFAVSKDCIYNSSFGKNNDFRNSEILKNLKEKILPKIEAEIGEENVLEFETDLISLDGSSKYGVMTSKVSLPTFDFYRKNRAVFEKYKAGKWWWLATPDSTDEYNTTEWVLCVSPSGDIDGFNYGVSGVRPFWRFVSSIFVSCEE